MNVRSSLKLFGLEGKEVDLYLLLLKQDWSTALQLSRKSPIKRTTLYRVLDSLEKKGFIQVKIDDKTTYYEAASPKQLKSVVIDKETKAKELRDVYSALHSSLEELSVTKPGETTVRFFRGIRGIKQMEWRIFDKGNKEVLIFGSELQWADAVGKGFAEKIRQETLDKKVLIKELVNEGSFEKIKPGGKVTYTDNRDYILNCFRHRVIPRETISIVQDIYIYNNYIQFHGYRGGDVFGVEMNSPDFAGMLRQMFESIWNQAKVFDAFGGEDFKQVLK